MQKQIRNRRVRNRTHGAVGGRRGQPRLLPSQLKILNKTLEEEAVNTFCIQWLKKFVLI
jgi:hypothetical protein